MANDLDGKSALVTGGARGIGRAIARELGARGAFVLINYARDEGAAAEAVAEVEAAGGAAAAIRADVGEVSQVRGLFARVDEELARRGRRGLDILVNNAGVAPDSPVEATDEEAFDRLFDVNVKGVFFVTQEALKRMREGGRVVNLSTVLTRTGAFAHKAAYAATKGAVDVLTRNLAQALGPRGITVNAVSPGAIDTDMNADWLRGEEGRRAITDAQALKRVGEPGDVAAVAAFLASPAAGWVTGQNVEASGGFRL
jgi:3-oxoacyl-[acyl-carrier protein] reductase